MKLPGFLLLAQLIHLSSAQLFKRQNYAAGSAAKEVTMFNKRTDAVCVDTQVVLTTWGQPRLSLTLIGMDLRDEQAFENWSKFGLNIWLGPITNEQLLVAMETYPWMPVQLWFVFEGLMLRADLGTTREQQLQGDGVAKLWRECKLLKEGKLECVCDTANTGYSALGSS
ncbi:hypothetical protein BCR37DRAFT_386764 [Protomyces lactucae-debilis]|uniref:Uncharacterized protein n=1 Tax=Protomyces lactucae-debilis TaxID=2754530 RepID=A0A1Y2FKK8_PROLT|nr:uncharacterized protein BCR37DRAFT_386764 [Protomyces lactucae-debilis]ORY83746.1 hypothetical protein BCR37DRAFT_386764 [Protomyces lactucae-debilis]